jgi:hypothetical protein
MTNIPGPDNNKIFTINAPTTIGSNPFNWIWTPPSDLRTFIAVSPTPTPTVTANLGAHRIDFSGVSAIFTPGNTPIALQLYLRAILNRNVVLTYFNRGGDFAILRPKPDETSVIIEFEKSLGDVSQTMLIPQDANLELKQAVGNIFENLNRNLLTTKP